MKSGRFFSALLAALVLGLLASPAAAQYVDRDDDMRFEDAFSRDEFMVAARARAVFIPDFLLGLWFDNHASHWSDGQSNMAYGAEFIWRKWEYEFSLGLEYADLSMASAFWKEKGDDAGSAEWTEIDMQLFSVVFSTYWYWDVADWFAPFVGGGIGPGFVLGDIVKYKPERDSACYGALGGTDAFAPPECFTPGGEPDPAAFGEPTIEDNIPAVIPVINMSFGGRFNLGRHGVLKIETGFHNYLYAGMALGGQW